MFALGAIGRSRALAAGVTFTNRTTSAPWGNRVFHTSVIDAAGTIYVIGGDGGDAIYQDVWASTDGGADRTRAGGGRGYWLGPQGVLRGYYRGTTGGTSWYHCAHVQWVWVCVRASVCVCMCV